jgi:uncharacterized protein (TIGR02596 family)
MRRAFSLIELLVVVAIMGLLLGMSGLAFQGSLKTQSLNAAARQLGADLDYAALLARKENRPVDVLFYRYQPQDSLGPAAVRAYQFGVLEGFTPAGTPTYRFLAEAKKFPASIAMSPNEEYTTLAKLTASPSLTDQPGGVTEDYTYYSYQIRPDGSTTLESGRLHPFTLVFDKDLEAGTLPADFRTVVVNPANARTRVY